MNIKNMNAKVMIISILLLLGSFLSYSQQEYGILKVQGMSSMQVRPDEAVARFSFEIIQMDYEKTIKILGDKADQLKNTLKKAEFNEENLETVMFNVNINRIYQRGQQKDSGYVARQIMELKFPYQPENMIRLINSVSGTNTGPGIMFSFQLSDQQMETVKMELITMAVKDARQKAEVIAKSSMTFIDGVKEIVYGGITGPEPQMLRVMESTAAIESNYGGFNVQDLTMKESIEITYLIKAGQ